MMLLITSLLVLGYTQSVLCTASLTLLTAAKCGDEAVLTCISTECDVGYTFIKDGVTILNQASSFNGSNVNKYSVNVRSPSQAQLTIRNIELSDSGTYSCNCRFDPVSPGQTLQYLCEANTSSPSVNTNKQLSIAVDRLYPHPSSITTALTNPITQVPGNYTCEPSYTFASHYMCTWVSTASLPDGNHSYTITVTTGRAGIPAALVNGSFRIATPMSPTVYNLVTVNNSRRVLRGVQDTPLTIQCVSRGGIPAPTLAWYRGNTSTSPLAQSTTSDLVQESEGTHTVTLTYMFTPRRNDDMTAYWCRVFYPGAKTGASPDPTPASALLYLDIKPESPLVSQTGEAISGGSITLRCTSANGRPAPSITWFYRGQTKTPTITSSYNTTSETYTVVSLLQRPVSAIDNGLTATCKVLHTTLSEPLIKTIDVDVKFGPSDASIHGNQATPATGNSKIRLNCTSGTSNPASNITWYNGSGVISNEKVNNTRWSGDNNGVITSNILTITPTRYMDGNRITCETGNGFGIDNNFVNLDILYSPIIQLPTHITAVEGTPDFLLTCSASSKPPARFTWYKDTSVLTNGVGTLTNNSLSYVIALVNRTDFGSYRCLADNSVGDHYSREIYLYVEHPPTVYVSISTSPNYTVTCTAEGYPKNYTYQDWVQIWPNYGPVATIPFKGTTLTLVGDTYERSGVYVCAASNGVAAYGKGVSFAKGNASIVIKAPPVLIDPSPESKTVRVGGILGQNATTEIKYWSNVDGSVVRCFKVGGSRQNTLCYVTETTTIVTLRVLNHNVKETGSLATIKIPINLPGDFADYDIVVSNNVQEDPVLGITIFKQGPPTTPTIMGNLSITPGQVILTVVPGFHGGYNQTLVVQISTDLITWINETSVYIGQDNRPRDVHLIDLQGGFLHYIRVFAYNIDGGSNLSSHLKFTTTEVSARQSSVALIAGVVVGVCVPVIIGVALFIMWRLRRGTGKHSRTKDTRNIVTNSEHSDTVVECAMYISAGVVQSGLSTGTLYSKPQKKDKQQVSSDVYAVVKKTKKDVYENSPESFKNGEKKNPQNPRTAKRSAASRPKKNISTDGLIYAELEFNHNPKKSTIHGLDNATTYVQVDFTKAADPLPDSDEETRAEK